MKMKVLKRGAETLGHVEKFRFSAKIIEKYSLHVDKEKDT